MFGVSWETVLQNPFVVIKYQRVKTSSQSRYMNIKENNEQPVFHILPTM